MRWLLAPCWFLRPCAISLSFSGLGVGVQGSEGVGVGVCVGGGGCVRRKRGLIGGIFAFRVFEHAIRLISHNILIEWFLLN